MHVLARARVKDIAIGRSEQPVLIVTPDFPPHICRFQRVRQYPVQSRPGIGGWRPHFARFLDS
jgi:hypothetical protein